MNSHTIHLLIGIVAVLMMLGICISIDYADNTTITNIDGKPMEIHNKSIIVVNDSSSLAINGGCSTFVPKSTDKIHTVKSKKSKVAKITMTGKPSCGCRYAYKWHTRTYVNYCPNCGRYGTLHNAHKWGARYEQEISCSHCDSDYCITCGKEKYSWSRVYLRKG